MHEQSAHSNIKHSGDEAQLDCGIQCVGECKYISNIFSFATISLRITHFVAIAIKMCSPTKTEEAAEQKKYQFYLTLTSHSFFNILPFARIFIHSNVNCHQIFWLV